MKEELQQMIETVFLKLGYSLEGGVIIQEVIEGIVINDYNHEIYDPTLMDEEYSFKYQIHSSDKNDNLGKR